MNTAKQFSPTIKRLTTLIERRYNCDFKYQPLAELNINSSEALKLSLSEGLPVTAGDWVFFPVFLGESLAGAGCISNRDNLTDRDLKYLNQVIRLVLEASLKHIDEIHTLSDLEDHVDSRVRNNVVALRPFQKNLFPLPENDVTSALNFPFLIESQKAEDIYKMAIEIHSRTNRYAMLPLEDINPAALAKPEDLRSLGHITIFVQDIYALSREQQTQILKYYHSPRGKECPQFITGTLSPIGTLKDNPKIVSELVPLLNIGYLCMSKSFAEYKRENVLDFFYDCLTGRTSV
ncbi:MAG: hypothetical protein KDD38_03610 [Bdellovibrionales bacterium]|nr:hypothetical protein [Bdellovibrionales bacterium]